MTSEFTIYANDVLKVFASLGVHDMQRVHKKALAASAKVLVGEAKIKLAGVTPRSASMQKGIRSYVSKNVDYAKVHILGDHRLKYFEMGTDLSKTKKGYKRGKMFRDSKSRPFFSPAINAAKGRMIETMRKTIVDAVKKRAKQ